MHAPIAKPLKSEDQLMPRSKFHFLPDPFFGVYRCTECRYLPHIHAIGAIYHCCFRLADSMPMELLKQWRQQLDDYMTMITNGWCLANEHQAPSFDPASMAHHYYLSAGAGECILRDDRFAQVVWDSLWYRDKEEYYLHAVAIMPNHVHVIVEPKDNVKLSDIVRNWKSYTAHVINQLRDTPGQKVWLSETYDHIIRSKEEYRNQVNYVVRNPVRAGLHNWRWVWPAQELPAPMDDWPRMPDISWLPPDADDQI